MKEITLKEFEEKYMVSNERWDFSKFSIMCRKCGSSKVEYNNTLEVDTGYYDDIERSGELVVKCHSCGNAFKLDAWQDLIKDN